MSEEKQGSSGSSTAMIVVAILVGILLVGCCGGALLLGAGALFAHSFEVKSVDFQGADTMSMPTNVPPIIQEPPLPIKEMPVEPPAPPEPSGERFDVVPSPEEK